MKKAVLVVLVVLLACGSVFAAGQQEAEYPNRPVTIVCPWAAGGGTDRIARFMAEELTEILGEQVKVENKTGGAGAVGHGEVANAKPDGYTVGFITFEMNTLKYLGYSDLTPEDVIPLVQINEDAAAVTVAADAPYDSVTDLLDAIKEEPEGTFSFSGSGIGTVWDLARIAMLDEYGIDPNRVKYIPSEGAAPATTELLGGHVDVITCSYPEVASQVEGGKLKTLGIMADERNPQFDEVPTLKEQGVDWSYGTWRGFAVPLDTPDEVVDTLTEAILEVVEGEAYQEFMEDNGFGVEIRVGEEYREFMMEQFVELEDIFELAGYDE